MRRNHQAPSAKDAEHTPVLAMWYQTRSALADLVIPLLAGFKTVWLIVFAPVLFFHAYCYQTRPLADLRSPFDPFWRTLSPDERRPLEPAHFLLFGIFAAALSGFEFAKSNRLFNQLGNGESGLTYTLVMAAARQNPALHQVVNNVQGFFQSNVVTQTLSFVDLSIFAAIVELIVNLFLLMIFAYLFHILTKRRISTTHSYAFWMYMAGIQFFTTAVSSLSFSFFSLPALNLAQVTPELIFLSLETILGVVWQYLFPMLILPQIFPAMLTKKQVLIAAVSGRLIMAVLGWFLFGGFVIILAFWG